MNHLHTWFSENTLTNPFYMIKWVFINSAIYFAHLGINAIISIGFKQPWWINKLRWWCCRSSKIPAGDGCSWRKPEIYCGGSYNRKESVKPLKEHTQKIKIKTSFDVYRGSIPSNTIVGKTMMFRVIKHASYRGLHV